MHFRVLSFFLFIAESSSMEGVFKDCRDWGDSFEKSLRDKRPERDLIKALIIKKVEVSLRTVAHF